MVIFAYIEEAVICRVRVLNKHIKRQLNLKILFAKPEVLIFNCIKDTAYRKIKNNLNINCKDRISKIYK